MGRGYQVTVLAWDRDSDYAPKEETLKLADYECRIFRIGIKGQFSGGIKKNLKGLLRFQSFIYHWLVAHKNEYDVIHAYDLDTGFTAQKAARKLQKVFVYDIPDYYSNGHGYTGVLRKSVNLVENSIINRAFATIICTEERKEEIKGSHPKRLFVIHNTPNIPVIQEETVQHDRFRIAYIGIFGKQRFIEEMTEFVSKRKDCELHIGGFGANMEPYIESMAKEFDNIIYYGRVPYQKTIQIERDCDTLAIVYDPSILNHKFAAPNKFYEALALGKPMIMAKNTGMASAVEEYDLGETIHYDTQSFEEAVDRLIARKSEWPAIGRRAQELYVSSYSWAEMENRIYKLYDEVALQIK